MPSRSPTCRSKLMGNSRVAFGCEGCCCDGVTRDCRFAWDCRVALEPLATGYAEISVKNVSTDNVTRPIHIYPSPARQHGQIIIPPHGHEFEPERKRVSTPSWTYPPSDGRSAALVIFDNYNGCGAAYNHARPDPSQFGRPDRCPNRPLLRSRLFLTHSGSQICARWFSGLRVRIGC